MALTIKRAINWLTRHEFILVLLLAITLLRIPNLFEPYWYGDEGIYLAVGQAMAKGRLLYAEIIDHKTPLIYYLAALTQTQFAFKLSLLAASLSSIVLFDRLSRHLLNQRFAPLSTVVFALLTTLPLFEGNILNGEILLMPFILAGMLIFWRYFPKKISRSPDLANFVKSSPFIPLTIGVFFGLAILTKVPSGFDFGALILFLLLFVPWWRWSSTRTNSLFWGLLLLGGVLLPILISILVFYFQGTLNAYYDFGLLYNFRYIQSWGEPFKHPVAIFLSSMLGRLLLLGLFSLVIWLKRHRLGLPLTFTLFWFGLSFFASLLSLRPYPHYFIQALPAASLLFGFLLQSPPKRRLGIFIVFLLTWFILKQLSFSTYRSLSYYQNFIDFSLGKKSQTDYRRWFDAKTPRIYEAAYFLKTRTEPSDSIFIWGNEPLVYALSNRTPTGRFTTDFHIVSFNAFDETINALNQDKPLYILDYKQKPESFPALYDLLSTDYLPSAELDGAIVYRLLSLP